MVYASHSRMVLPMPDEAVSRHWTSATQYVAALGINKSKSDKDKDRLSRPFVHVMLGHNHFMVCLFSVSMSQGNAKITKGKLIKAYRIFSFAKRYQWSFTAGLFCLVISSALFMVFPAAAGEMANAAIGKGQWGIPVKQFGWIFLAILIAQGLLSYLRTIFFARVSEHGMAEVRKALYEKLITQEIAFLESHRVGELTSRITADVEQLQTAFSITLAEFIRQVVVLLLGVSIIFYTVPKLTAIMLLTFPLIVVASIFFGKFIRKLSRQRQDALAQTNVIVEESFQSFHTVKAFTNEDFEVNRYAKSIKQMVDISMHYAKMRGLFFIFIITVLFGGLFFILWRGALMVQDPHSGLEIGELFSFIFYTGIIGAAIASIGNLYSTLAGSIGATERILDILDRPNEISINAKAAAAPLRLQGDIEFVSVHFEYPSRPDVAVLKNIHLKVTRGQRIALVGPSGAGKSTIVQLLMRFYNLTEGCILVDGKDIREYDLWAYRKNFAIVPQEILLFGGTIRENIAYGKPDASEEEIVRAAIQANAWEFIRGFPEQLDTVVGERGIKLSGGQKQRIAIARAILRDPAILILDEATSNLDSESERSVQMALHNLMANRTSVIIAHRLSTIRESDCIYVVKDGRIAEVGRHEDLIEVENGVYKNLVQMQMETAS